ncbi:hypothetical protein PUNSTDRAFT_136024 [Punctularia strigosozonata HHB-11173 SS5]|uniref:uncharacterized protein n=1 Tax=Punctularia strigosozonata (strain HHB-11173) TaxID=741275 RepID=UPI00044181A4|nr:uncharacterized protein PUNSTDRAFT_136024 [Punctularia strigosozonata HHB-11173 SS5]EIN07340.1 hypothetical protein PUNSTDRAFT_136024 [Punctularia strigosozonata HHB-11173 SS5]
MKLSFSLGAKKAQQPVGEKPAIKAPSAFAAADDDTLDAAPTASDKGGGASANKQLLARNVVVSQAMKRRMEAEKKVDETVFEYDEVWDKMQEAKARQKLAKEEDAKVRKPKYIGGLLATAQTRKLDHLRAEEKMIQRERELEGDEFKEKEQFVTQAYKDQMAEVRRAEEEEKKREELERKKRGGAPGGLAHLYAQLLNESEQQHQETVAATMQPEIKEPPRRSGIIGPAAPNLTIVKPPELTAPSDVELARIARGQGKSVELNDDNQIVDKRELLSAGLNLAAPNTRKLGLVTKNKKGGGGEGGGGGEVQAHRAVGAAASKREIDERRRREIVKQMEEEKYRAREEREKEEAERQARIVAKRNTEEDVMSAKERYLARKRRKLEEQQAAEAAAATATEAAAVS